ncbi:hypothetical protein [Acholeplasma laidlawii]|uniref:hypothetical protein n=1 Tax=Acholeplasma laidlawii TaxID=2148 RepID=UPI0021F6E74D|nr:hypothetical protein [Acholeplasma laidlawii]
MIGKVLSWAAKGAKKIIESDSGKRALGAAAVAGVGLSAHGIGNAVKAKKKNKNALSIQEEAKQSLDIKNKETNEAIAKLGDAKIKAINLFPLFIEQLKRIDRHPSISEFKLDVDLPKITEAELLKMHNAISTITIGTVASSVGVLAGVGLFGFTIGVIPLGILSGGIGLFIKGNKLSRESVKNLKEARKYEKEVSLVILELDKISNGSKILEESIKIINKVYEERIIKLSKMVDKNDDYDKFSKKEKQFIANTLKLTYLLSAMCKTVPVEDLGEEQIANDEIHVILEKTALIQKNINKENIFKKVFAVAKA